MTVVDVRPTALVRLPAPRLPAAGEVIPPPVVVPGEVVQSCTTRPVHGWPPVCPWAITDPAEVDAIRERMRWHRAPWWWRLAHPRPAEPTHLTPRFLREVGCG